MQDDAIDDPGERLGEPGSAVTDDTPIVAERSRLLLPRDTPPGPVSVRPAPVRHAAVSEIPVLAGVLARAFAADPMVRWPMVSDDELPGRIRTMFEIVDSAYADEGWIYTAAEGLGVMSLMPPASAQRERELADVTAPALAALTPDLGERYERFWAWIGSMLPPEPHWLLDQVAVEPAAQGRGIGGAMLRFAIERAERDGLPVCLETGAPANVPLYERFGFRVTREAAAPDGGPHVWFMRRNPG
jgi:GNAT superfamily N-acetyltransferase